MRSEKRIVFKLFLFLNIITALEIPCMYYFVSNFSKYMLIINIITFVLLLAMLKKIKIKGNRFSLYIFIYYVILIISTIINNNSCITLIKETCLFITPIIVLNSLSKEEFEDNLVVIVFAFEVLSYINLATVLFFPNGLYNVGLSRKFYLLGHVNISVRYLLPGSCFSLLRSYIKSNKITFRTILYLLCSILTLLITWPATGIAGYATFAILLILLNLLPKFKNIFNPANSFLINVGISYLIIFIRIQERFQRFLINVLHRDATFTGRTKIWALVLKYIYDNPIHGYGRMIEDVRREVLNTASSAHNQYLNILFEGGIILLVYFAFLFFSLKNKLSKCKNKYVVNVFAAAIFSYTLMWIFEPFSYSGTFAMFLVFAVTYKSDVLFNESHGEEIE